MAIKTINLRLDNGDTLDMTSRIVATTNTLNQPSVIRLISEPTGIDFRGGKIVKVRKRIPVEQTTVPVEKMTSGFIGASNQIVSKVDAFKIVREDNIISSKIDMAYLKEGKGGDLTSKETINFLLTNEELDLKLCLKELTEQANSMKIYTSASSTGLPTGKQPDQTDNTFAGAMNAIKFGKRIVTVLGAKGDEVLDLTREGIGYLNRIGTDHSIETLYPFSINGLPLHSQAILTTYSKIGFFKDSFTTAFIDLSNPNAVRNYNGIVGMIDTVPVILTNQIGSKDLCVIISTRTINRDLDEKTQYIGVISQGDGRAIKLRTKEVVNIKPSEFNTAFEQARLIALPYFEEVIVIRDVV